MITATQPSHQVSNQVQSIQSIRKEIPVAKDVFDLWAARVRGRQDVSMRRTLRVLREHGTEISRTQFETILAKLEAAGIGKRVKGRNDTKFVLSYHLISIAKAANGEANKLAPAPRGKVKLPHIALPMSEATQPAPVAETRAPSKFVKVSCNGFEMFVPLNATSEEMQSAAELIASLPKVKSNS